MSHAQLERRVEQNANDTEAIYEILKEHTLRFDGLDTRLDGLDEKMDVVIDILTSR